MNGLICQKCGGRIPNEFNHTLAFCTNCGASFQSPHTDKTLAFAAEPKTLQLAAAKNPAAPSNSARYLLGCLGLGFAVLMLSAAGVFGYWYWLRENSSHSDYYGKISPPQTQTVRFMILGEAEKLDPQTAGLQESIISKALFDALVEYDHQAANIKPSLAESWESNADATVWTFKIRREAKWSDGKPITAHDVVYSWRRALDNQTTSYNYVLLFCLKNAGKFNDRAARAEEVGVRAIDDYTLEATMEKPTPYFIKLVAAASVFRPVPEHGIGNHGKDWTLIRKEKMIVSGAFRLAEWSPGERIVLERNPQFWDNANTKLDKIIFPSWQKTAADNSEQIRLDKLYENGELDAMGTTTVPKESFEGKKDYLRVKGNGTEFISLNTTFAPLDDPRVRRALSQAIDREKLKEKNLSPFPSTSLVPEIKGYESAPGAGFNPEQARKLLAEAGFPNGVGFPEIEYIYNTSERNRDVAQFVQEQWQKELGLRVKLINMEFRNFLPKRRSLEYKGVARDGWVGDYADPYSLLGSVGEFGTGWNDKKYAELLEKANAEPDESKRVQILKEAESYLLEQQPVIPLFTNARAMLCKPFVKNLAPNALDLINWREVYIDANWKAK